MISATEIRKSRIEGSGVFARQDIACGTAMHRMGGREVSRLRCVAGIIAGTIRKDDPLSVSATTYLVLDEQSVAFNHSCNPNAVVNRDWDMVAIRDIARGEEITFDYSLTVPVSLLTRPWSMECKCGAPNCRKRLGTIASLNDAELQIYEAFRPLLPHVEEYLTALARKVVKA